MKQLPTFFSSSFFVIMVTSSLLMCFSITSCQRENQILPTKVISPAQRAAIEQAGFHSQGAFFDKFGNIVVEGDIAIAPQLLLSASAENANDRQRVAGEFCSRSYIPTGLPIAYFISEAFDDTWKQAIQEGVTAWESPKNNCSFIAVNSMNEAYIVIERDDELGANVYGVADFPCMNHGRNIFLNVHETEADHGSTLLSACIKNIVTHEMGHSFGFHHTDSQANVLSGTPESDPNSIMLSGASWPIPDGLEWFGNLPGPDGYDFLMAEYFFPRDGAHVEIEQVQISSSGNGLSSVRFKFKQVTALCYHISYEFKNGEALIQAGESLSDGTTEGWISIPGFYTPGTYTLTLCGKNYAQDYNDVCQLKATRVIEILVPTCCPVDK